MVVETGDIRMERTGFQEVLVAKIDDDILDIIVQLCLQEVSTISLKYRIHMYLFETMLSSRSDLCSSTASNALFLTSTCM